MFEQLRLRTKLLVLIFVATSVIVGLWSLGLVHPALRLPTWAFAPLGLVAISFHIIWASRFDRFKREAHRRRWRLCLICGSAVARRGKNYQCPECGRRFSARQLIQGWR